MRRQVVADRARVGVVGPMLRFRFLVLLSLSLLLVAPISTAALVVTKTGSSVVPMSGDIRYDQRVSFLWGNLTWKDGAGRIVWGPTEPTHGGGGTPDAAVELQWQQGDDVEEQTGRPLAPYPGPDVFTSDPLPRSIHLDVTRSILVDLAVKDTASFPSACGTQYTATMASTADLHLDLELEAAGRLLGGAQGSNRINWYWAGLDNKRPSDPEGYSVCHFAVSPEAAILQEKTVIKVRVIHVMQQFFFTYGFGGDHPSTIRIPLLAPEEVLYRYPPSEDPLEDATGTSTSTAAASVWVAALAVAAAGLGTRNARRTALLVSLLLAAGGLAGCVGSKGTTKAEQEIAQGGKVDHSLVEDTTGELVSAGTGTILGQVHDDLHIPVQGAHVSILGHTLFTTTDAKGRFRFEGLPTGVFKLRFDRQEYRSFETEVEVKVGFVSKPSVMLYLANPQERDFRPHSHDYWLGISDTKTVFDAPIPIACSGSPPVCPVSGNFYLAPTQTDPNSVLPGTYNVEVRLTFNGDMPADEIGLFVRTALPGFNFTYYPPRPSGVPFQIATTWEMTDPGHAPYSYWTFAWAVAKRAVPSELDSKIEQVTKPMLSPSLRAKVVLTKGPALPLEPAHPNDWGDKTQLPVLTQAPVDYLYNLYAPGSPTGWSDTTGKAPIPRASGSAPRKVPLGTKNLEVTLTQNDKPKTDFHWVLRVKPGNVPPALARHATWDGYTAHHPTSVSSDGLTTKWTVPVKDVETDFIYGKATSSGWMYYLEPSDYQAWWQDTVVRQNTNAHAAVQNVVMPKITMQATIVANKG